MEDCLFSSALQPLSLWPAILSWKGCLSISHYGYLCGLISPPHLGQGLSAPLYFNSTNVSRAPAGCQAPWGLMREGNMILQSGIYVSVREQRSSIAQTTTLHGQSQWSFGNLSQERGLVLDGWKWFIFSQVQAGLWLGDGPGSNGWKEVQQLLLSAQSLGMGFWGAVSTPSVMLSYLSGGARGILEPRLLQAPSEYRKNI